MLLAHRLTAGLRLLQAAAALAVMACALAPPPARADFLEHYWERHLDNQSRAWCAYYSGISSYIECSFDTFAQCRTTISGVGGFCAANPSYIAATDATPERRHPRHRHYEPR